MTRKRFIKLMMSIGETPREAAYSAKYIKLRHWIAQRHHSYNVGWTYETYYLNAKLYPPGLRIKIPKAKAQHLEKIGNLLDLPRNVHESNRSYRKRLFEKMTHEVKEKTE